MTPAAGFICIVTVHGIGFQQAPDADAGIAGYADRLHQRLIPHLARLDLVLGSDPDPVRKGQVGPVYVQSHWPTDTRDREAGLVRLDKPLFDGHADVGHVALVYSHLEDQGPQLEVTLETLGRTLLGAGAYVSPGALLHMLVQDVRALRTPPQRTAEAPSGLLVRTELRHHQRALWHAMHLRPPEESAPPGLFGVLRALENDVAAYVYRNDLRERVRSFVRQSIFRLLARPDVTTLVVNSHSQGTVVVYDVLKDLSPADSKRISLLVTAGSPLRKYVDLFNWGADAGSAGGVEWRNFLDDCDPVADRLTPPADWKRGDDLPKDADKTLFDVQHADGTTSPVRTEDTIVDNVANSLGTDLRAHNYWDNDVDFVPRLARAIGGAG
ncbi:MAG: hypothetical protein ACHQ7M_00710 [Chloroflexota bacterium]